MRMARPAHEITVEQADRELEPDFRLVEKTF
jgi:hypothetical protein